MGEKAIRWGICSAGNICNDFTAGLASLPNNEHQVKAVASSSVDRSNEFAKKFGIPKAYGSYQELANDPDVDVVYIGSLNTQHYAHCKMMLNGGKAVLCERPVGLSPNDAVELSKLAKQKNLFFMEAMWCRCFPAYGAIRKAIDAGEIGEVRMIQGSMGISMPEIPSHRLMNKDLGGGALFSFGVYLLQLGQYVFQQKPTDVCGSGFLNSGGVDCTTGITLKYPGNKLASLVCSTVVSLTNDATISGTKGSIRVHPMCWCPTSITVNGQEREFPLPEVSHPLVYPNSQGLVYEAQEVRRCLLNNLLESPRFTHRMGIELAEVTEKIRKDIGYELSQK